MKQVLVYMALLFLVYACVEPFEFETRDAAGILVVQATITDMLQKHKVILSRAANLENVNVEIRDTLDVSGPIIKTIKERVNPENGANVRVIDSEGNSFDFEDNGEGVYESINEFALINTMNYQLQISTANNETYESNFVSVRGKSEISDVYAERGFNENGQEGMLIFVNGSDSQGQSNYFRYEYEETYKIIAPKYSGLELEIIREETIRINDSTVLWPDAKLANVTREERVCYNSESSGNINLASTAALSSSVLGGHQVRFINRNNAIISHRYSILVEQYLLSDGAFNYYQSLSNFAQSESVFSDIQPGFLEGNIQRTDVDSGLVLGYFEVASVARERLFFDYVDFFPNEELPPFFGDTNCDRIIAPALDNPERDGPRPTGCEHPPSLIRRIKSNEISYIGVNLEPGECEGPYLMIPSLCTDCTLLGSNVEPDFWVD